MQASNNLHTLPETAGCGQTVLRLAAAYPYFNS